MIHCNPASPFMTYDLSSDFGKIKLWFGAALRVFTTPAPAKCSTCRLLQDIDPVVGHESQLAPLDRESRYRGPPWALSLFKVPVTNPTAALVRTARLHRRADATSVGSKWKIGHGKVARSPSEGRAHLSTAEPKEPLALECTIY